MKITSNDWDNYINGQNAIKSKARELMQAWINQNGIEDRNALIGFANSLSTKYGEAAAAYACEMYEEIAAAAGVAIESAVPAATATFEETAKAVNGSLKQGPEGRLIPGVVERLVKQAGADTILHNAARDQAWFAWVPSSGSCAFCRVIASNGWRKASKSLLKSHAEHIHANCNCEFAVSFSPFMEIEGYDPEKYLEEYENASAESAGFNKKRAKGKQWQSNSTAKINAMRREDYLIDKDFINEQKRLLYAENKMDEVLLFFKETSLKDEYLPKSIGAKWQNYDIIDKQTGNIFHIAEGSKIQNKQIFAGYGSNTPLREEVAEGLADQFKGTKAEKWQHIKADAIIDYYGEDRAAEIHWFQEETAGKHKFKIKYWND